MCKCEKCGRPCMCGDRYCETCILDVEDESPPSENK